MKNLRNITFFLLYVALRPKLALLVFKGIHIPSYLQLEWTRDFKVGTVIDVGACRGDSLNAMRLLHPKAALYAFEPIEENFKVLSSRFSQVASINKLAISNKVGKARFYKNNVLQASSLLPIQTHKKSAYKLLSNASVVNVDTTTLDNFFGSIELRKTIFLKLDTQGTEDLTIKGGKTLLSHVSSIYIETSFRDLYKGQCFFDDIYNQLKNLGFEYAGGSLIDYGFYPYFGLPRSENSIFIRTKRG